MSIGEGGPGLGSPINLDAMVKQGLVSGDVSVESPAEQNHRLTEEAKRSAHGRTIEKSLLVAVAVLLGWMLYQYAQDNTPAEHKRIILQAVIGVGSSLLGYVVGKKSI